MHEEARTNFYWLIRFIFYHYFYELYKHTLTTLKSAAAASSRTQGPAYLLFLDSDSKAKYL